MREVGGQCREPLAALGCDNGRSHRPFAVIEFDHPSASVASERSEESHDFGRRIGERQ